MYFYPCVLYHVVVGVWGFHSTNGWWVIPCKTLSSTRRRACYPRVFILRWGLRTAAFRHTALNLAPVFPSSIATSAYTFSSPCHLWQPLFLLTLSCLIFSFILLCSIVLVYVVIYSFRFSLVIFYSLCHSLFCYSHFLFKFVHVCSLTLYSLFISHVLLNSRLVYYVVLSSALM